MHAQASRRAWSATPGSEIPRWPEVDAGRACLGTGKQNEEPHRRRDSSQQATEAVHGSSGTWRLRVDAVAVQPSPPRSAHRIAGSVPATHPPFAGPYPDAADGLDPAAPESGRSRAASRLRGPPMSGPRPICAPGLCCRTAGPPVPRIGVARTSILVMSWTRSHPSNGRSSNRRRIRTWRARRGSNPRPSDPKSSRPHRRAMRVGGPPKGLESDVGDRHSAYTWPVSAEEDFRKPWVRRPVSSV